jgi:hypothetical protein
MVTSRIDGKYLMADISEQPDPQVIESEARAIWKARHLPPVQGPVGLGGGPVVHQFEGSFAPQEAGMLLVQRVVAADVDARALILSGRRALGILRREEGGPVTTDPRMDALIAALGVWVGGPLSRGWDDAPRRAEVQTLVGRLAHLGAVAVRDVSLRICPACAVARDPERIVYQEEGGDTLLVRFPFQSGDRMISALVWTDAAWRLLGTSALMVHPDILYVVARYRRRGAEEFVFTSRSSLDRIRSWLPGADLEVVEEHPGRHWEGTPYVHPLRHEFPMGGSMTPPGGTIIPVTEVSDTGTGVVPLVPGHGGTDALIAERLGVPGWPLITTKGRFDIILVHKYAGLELASGSEFVVRDLAEGGSIFAQLRVRRGVPHCSRCGTALIWAPGRAWCLEPSRLPEEKVAVYRALLPRDRPIERLEAVPWPISEPSRSDDPHAISLLECTSCDRLEAMGREAERCACGGRRRAVRRRLLPAFDGAAAAWAQVDPFPGADSARLYVNERRRAPAVVHHVAAMSGIGGTVGDVRLTILPTVPEYDLAKLLETYGADAVRAAFVRTQASEGATATFPQRCAQERGRLDRFRATVHATLAQIDSASLSTYGQPIAGFFGELEPEDRALLARFEALRVQCLADYDRAAPAVVHRHLFHFLDNDLAVYRTWVAPRLALAASPPPKSAALRTLVHVIANSIMLLGPIAPHLAESTHRALRRSRASLFEETVAGVDRNLLDELRTKAWDRWASVVRTADQFRRSVGLAADALLPSVVLVLGSDPIADEYRAEAPTIERLARIRKIEVGSPGAPWPGRRHELRPVETEIQRVYPSRSAQIIHLLRRMPERKWADPSSGQEFSMMVNGQPTQILPSMIAWSETLPERYVPVGWPAGEMYAEIPEGSEVPIRPPPPLSPDAFRVVARVAHRLRSIPKSGALVAVVAAPGPLAAELSAVAGSVAIHLGLQEFRLVPSDQELPRRDREFGRTKVGGPWSFRIEGARAAARSPKARPMRVHGDRVRPAFTPGQLAPSVIDYADPGLLAQEAAVRALEEELDGLLGAPVLGPTKVAAAWNIGLRSVDAYRQAPWVTLVGLPGFGVPVATALVSKFGGTVPPRPPRGTMVSPPHPSPATESVPTGRGPSTEPGSPSLAARSPSILPASTTTAPDRGPSSPAPSTAPALPPGAASPPTAPIASVSVPPRPIYAPAVPPATEESGPGPTDHDPPIDDETSPATTAWTDTPGHQLAQSEPGEIPGTGETSPNEETGPDLSPIPLPAPGDVDLDGSSTAKISSPPTPVSSPEFEASTPGEERNEQAALTSEPVDTSSDGPSPDEPLSTIDSVRTASSLSTLNPPSGEEVPVTASAPQSSSSGPVDVAPASGEALSIAPPKSPELQESDAAEDLTQPPPDAGPSTPVEAIPPKDEISMDVTAPGPPESEPPAVELPLPVAAESVASSAPALPQLSSAPPIETATPEPYVPAIDPSVPLPSAAPSGGIEVVVGISYLPTLERFLEATAAGHQGICVVRDSPERVRAYVGSRPVDIRWLTNIGRGATLKPSDLDGFAAFLAHAASTGRVTAFFLEGVEYLVRLHGLEHVVVKMLSFDELARQNSARVWLPLNPKLLTVEELERFVSAFGGKAPQG